jgi:hypothetical protein
MGKEERLQPMTQTTPEQQGQIMLFAEQLLEWQDRRVSDIGSLVEIVKEIYNRGLHDGYAHKRDAR